LSNVLEFLGHNVLRVNHIGDWGTQFGMLICYMNKMIKEETTASSSPSSSLEDLSLGNLVEFYQKAKKLFDNDISFQEESRQEVVKLQSGNSSSLKAWKIICDKSRQEFQQIYSLLNIDSNKFIERGESFYNPMLPSLVKSLKDKGVAIESKGAVVIPLAEKKPDGDTGVSASGFCNETAALSFTDKELGASSTSSSSPSSPSAANPSSTTVNSTSPPFMIQKSDGGYLYATTDLAALQYRLEHDKANSLLYVTDNGQSQHFQMLFKAAVLAGLLPRSPSSHFSQESFESKNEKKVEISHVPFGLVLGEDGKKIKTRSGESVKLKDLLNESIEKAKEEFFKRKIERLSRETVSASSTSVEGEVKKEEGSRGNTNEEDEKEMQRKSQIMGIGAIKYCDLSMNRQSDYRFSFMKMLSLQGNTAPYMLYAYARIRGIQRKALTQLLASSLSSRLDDDSLSLYKEEILNQKIAEFFATLKKENINCFHLKEKEEFILGKHLLKSDDILIDVSNTFYPHKV
jgi:arginyl-tRNA synthetase